MTLTTFLRCGVAEAGLRIRVHSFTSSGCVHLFWNGRMPCILKRKDNAKKNWKLISHSKIYLLVGQESSVILWKLHCAWDEVCVSEVAKVFFKYDEDCCWLHLNFLSRYNCKMAGRKLKLDSSLINISLVWNLPSCVGDLLLQPHLAQANRVCVAGQCVCRVCAAPGRSARTPAMLQWRERRRRPQMSTPQMPGLQSCTWCLHDLLMCSRKKEKGQRMDIVQKSLGIIARFICLCVKYKGKRQERLT